MNWGAWFGLVTDLIYAAENACARAWGHVRKKALRTCTLGIVGHCLEFGVPLPCLVPLFRKEEGRVRWCSADRGPEGRARGVAQGYHTRRGTGTGYRSVT